MDHGAGRHQHRSAVSLLAAVSLLVVALITLVVNTPCVALWAACGRMLRRRSDDDRTRRVFDASMAALVAGTALWIVWPVVFPSRT